MLSMPLENLDQLDEVPVDKAHVHHMHSLSRSMNNIRSVEAPSFDGSADSSFDVLNSTLFDDGVEYLHQIGTPTCSNICMSV